MKPKATTPFYDIWYEVPADSLLEAYHCDEVVLHRQGQSVRFRPQSFRVFPEGAVLTGKKVGTDQTLTATNMTYYEFEGVARRENL